MILTLFRVRGPAPRLDNLPFVMYLTGQTPPASVGQWLPDEGILHTHNLLTPGGLPKGQLLLIYNYNSLTDSISPQAPKLSNSGFCRLFSVTSQQVT